MPPKLDPGDKINLNIEGETVAGTVVRWADEGTVVILTDGGEEIRVQVSHELRALSPLKRMDS